MSDIAQSPQVPPPSRILSTSQMLLGTRPSAAQPPADISAIAPAIPLAVQSSDTLNPANPTGGTVKEMHEPVVSLEQPQFEQVAGIQYVEKEKNPELPPEVDGFLKKVESHQDQLPQEVVVKQADFSMPPTKFLSKPVIVLPITPDEERAGQSKPTQYSIRWLIEWSRKMIKMFSGQIIYRTE